MKVVIMLILEVMSVYDSKAEVFAPPFLCKTVAEGQRSFLQACCDERCMLFQYPEDFRLMHLGRFNDNTGSFDNLPIVLFVCSGRRPVNGFRVEEVVRDGDSQPV